jgi:hypothetical protein
MDLTAIGGAGPAPAAAAPARGHGLTFLELLSDLNPLQHIPVVGTIYRAVTGDEISEAARNLGSLAVSGIIGGPLGLASNLAFLAVRKLTGLDPEKIGQDLLADIGIGHHAPGTGPGSSPNPNPNPAPAVGEPQEAGAGTETGTRGTPWSPLQLRAYGVACDADGTLRRGGDSGSDVLNGLLLAEMRPAPSDASRGAAGGAPKALVATS